MKVLGLGTEGDSGAAIVEDGRLVAAVNEERLSRLKLVEGFPRSAIVEVLRLSGTSIEELDAVLVAGREDRFVNDLHPFEGWFEHWGHGDAIGGLVKRAAGRLSRFGRRLPVLEKGYYALLTPSFLYRRHMIRRVLETEFGVRCPIRFVDHHFCHITSAYFTSGFDDALVLSLDGGGDGRSGLVYEVRDGEVRYLGDVSAYNSLGNYYAYVTHICGFKAQKHEGKITGLAAYGEPRYLDLIREFVGYEDGSFLNHGGVVFREAIRVLESRLPADWRREDLAASIQRHFETEVGRFAGYWQRRTGQSSLALAGGVFANVRVNQTLHELPGVERVFVHPGMSDGGLAVGAALAACVEGVLDRPMRRDPEPLRDVYLGSDLSAGEIEQALGEADLKPMALDGSLEQRVAELLAAGYVVARAAGRMEYGPRALGNRSILYQPTDASVNDWLNDSLHRTEFMPFAPAVLFEARDQCFEDVDGAEHTAEFMTVTFGCTAWMRQEMLGVVHLDGTARPQLVRRDRNESYYAIIEAFERLTGLPAVINTSFNMHEEPIVCSAADCVRAFLSGQLDYLAIGPHLVRHPNPRPRSLRPVHVGEAAALRSR